MLYGLSLSSLELGAPFSGGVLVEAGSGKEFFDELADNLEARSDRYTNQSDPGITALF